MGKSADQQIQNAQLAACLQDSLKILVVGMELQMLPVYCHPRTLELPAKGKLPPSWLRLLQETLL